MRDDSEIRALHKTYCAETGLVIPLSMQRIFTWEAWCAGGFTAGDLRLVVGFLKRKIQDGAKTLACLRFNNLIGNREYFEEDLAEARALARAPKRDAAKEAVLRTAGRPPETVTGGARSAAEILAGEEAFKRFVSLKQDL